MGKIFCMHVSLISVTKSVMAQNTTFNAKKNKTLNDATNKCTKFQIR